MKFLFYIFVPHHFLSTRSTKQLILCHKKCDNHVLINCIFAVPLHSNCLKGFYENYEREFQLHQVGVLSPQECPKAEVLDNQQNRDLYFNLGVNHSENKIAVNIFIYEKTLVSSERVNVVIYDGCALVTSELLYKEAELTGRNIFKDSFIQFLFDTVNYSLEIGLSLAINLSKNNALSSNKNSILSTSEHYCDRNFISVKLESSICCMALIFGYWYQFVCLWWPDFLKTVFLKTGFGRHFYRRLLLINCISEQLNKRRSLSLQSMNIIVSIILDLAIGWFVVYSLQPLVTSNYLLQNAVDTANNLVDWLEKLIIWLMGAPAGLKLNIPLNNALGQFFLYHIYLWKTYFATVVPIFKVLLQILTLVGCLGFTYIPSVFSDLISLMTIHVYCFYGYASRIYYYQLTSLLTLWRVFRGKKWNPETQRVETFTYAVHHLYIGTLLFTVLFFLLPTVMVYYFVFAALYVIVLLLQGLITRFADILAVFPIYALCLRIFHSPQTTGGLFFSVLKTEPTLVLSMEVIQQDILSVIKTTYPQVTKEQPSQSFVSSFLSGKMMYPI